MLLQEILGGLRHILVHFEPYREAHRAWEKKVIRWFIIIPRPGNEASIDKLSCYREVSPDQGFHELKFIGEKKYRSTTKGAQSVIIGIPICLVVDSQSYLDVYVIYQEIEHLN